MWQSCPHCLYLNQVIRWSPSPHPSLFFCLVHRNGLQKEKRKKSSCWRSVRGLGALDWMVLFSHSLYTNYCTLCYPPSFLYLYDMICSWFSRRHGRRLTRSVRISTAMEPLSTPVMRVFLSLNVMPDVAISCRTSKYTDVILKLYSYWMPMRRLR